MYRASAIRALCKITDVSMHVPGVEIVFFFLKRAVTKFQTCILHNPYVFMQDTVHQHPDRNLTEDLTGVLI